MVENYVLSRSLYVLEKMFMSLYAFTTRTHHSTGSNFQQAQSAPLCLLFGRESFEEIAHFSLIQCCSQFAGLFAAWANDILLEFACNSSYWLFASQFHSNYLPLFMDLNDRVIILPSPTTWVLAELLSSLIHGFLQQEQSYNIPQPLKRKEKNASENVVC